MLQTGSTKGREAPSGTLASLSESRKSIPSVASSKQDKQQIGQQGRGFDAPRTGPSSDQLSHVRQIGRLKKEAKPARLRESRPQRAQLGKGTAFEIHKDGDCLKSF